MAATNPFADPNFGSDLNTAPSNPFADPNFGKPSEPKRGAAGEILNQLYAGTIVDAPKMAGQAMQYLSDPGNSLYEFGKGISQSAEERGKRPDLQPDEAGHNVVTNALASGARMIPQSVIPAAAVGGALALSPVAVPSLAVAGASALAGAVPYGLSQGQQTLEKAREKGVPENEALTASRINALIEGGGESLGNFLGYRFLTGVGKAARKVAGKTAAQNVLRETADTSVVKPFVKELPKIAAVETGTEMGQNYGEAAVEKAYGIDTQDPIEAARQAIAPTLGMTALLASFGLIGFARTSKNKKHLIDTLASGDADPAERIKMSNAIFNSIKEQDPEAAANWRDNTSAAIANKEPITLDDSFIAKPGGPFPPNQFMQNRSPSANPFSDPNFGLNEVTIEGGVSPERQAQFDTETVNLTNPYLPTPGSPAQLPSVPAKSEDGRVGLGLRNETIEAAPAPVEAPPSTAGLEVGYGNVPVSNTLPRESVSTSNPVIAQVERLKAAVTAGVQVGPNSRAAAQIDTGYLANQLAGQAGLATPPIQAVPAAQKQPKPAAEATQEAVATPQIAPPQAAPTQSGPTVGEPLKTPATGRVLSLPMAKLRAAQLTKATGVPHQVEAHPTEQGKFTVVPEQPADRPVESVATPEVPLETPTDGPSVALEAAQTPTPPTTQGQAVETPVAAKPAAKQPWEMTNDEYAQAELANNEYRGEYESNPELKKEYLQDQERAWRAALIERAREGKIPENVLDDYVEKYGVQSLQSEFRGAYEKGTRGYVVPDIRNQKGREEYARTVWDKKPWERTLKEQRLVESSGERLATPPAYWKKIKDNHRSQIQKAIWAGEIVPAEVLKDYPDLQKQAVSASKAAKPAAKQPWEMTATELDAVYPRAKDTVDGRIVGDKIDNTSSIGSSIDNATELSDVREVPMSAFTLTGKHYSVEGTKRIESLANQIKESGRVDPLIVAIDKDGPYILEGATRAEALHRLGAKSFPALVVMDEGSLHSAVKKALSEGKPVPAEVLKEYPDLQATRQVEAPPQPENANAQQNAENDTSSIQTPENIGQKNEGDISGVLAKGQEAEVAVAKPEAIKEPPAVEHGKREINTGYLKAKFKKGQYDIPLSTGDKVNINAAKIGDLLVHKSITPQGATGDTYTVTHIQSGKAVLSGIDKLSTARISAYRLSKMIDWTKDERAIQDQFNALVDRNNYNKLRYDPYAEILGKKPAEPKAEERTTAKPKNMAGEVRSERTKPNTAPEFQNLHPKAQEKFNAAWDTKNVTAMQEYLDPANKGLRAEFENRSGEKLPKTISGTNKAIEEFFSKITKTTAPVAESQDKTVSVKGEPSTKQNTEDSGKELTYNKRNRIARLSWDDIKDKDAALRVRETTKSKVYPRPDYQAMVDGGMQPLIAHIVKQTYDALASKPNTRIAPTDAQLEEYINGVNRYMDGVMTWANDRGKVGAFIQKLAGKAKVLQRASAGVPTALSSLDYVGEKSMLETVYPDGWRNSIDEVRLIGGNKTLAALQPSTNEAVRAMNEINKGWPSAQEAWQRQGYRVVNGDDMKSSVYAGTRTDGTKYAAISYKIDGRTISTEYVEGAENESDKAVQDEIKSGIDEIKGKYLLLNKNNKPVGAFDSESAAQDKARELTARGGKKTISDKGISVTSAERTGADRRMEGEDINSDKLRDTFGFNGVNFGNWMKGKSNEAERQLHLNHAYDSFMDLAELMGVPHKAMSLNGMLGLAIGAQGTGQYAAHFVPGVNEINLTRTSGAGSLAHEFAHAVDHYFARLAGLERKADPFLTNNVNLSEKSLSQELRPEMLDGFKSIVRSMNTKAETEAERNLRREISIKRAEKNVAGWLDSIRKDFIREGVKESVFDTRADRIKRLDLGDGMVAVSGSKALHQAISELRELYKTASGRVYSLDRMIGMQNNVDHLKYLKSDKEQASEHIPQTPTDYSREAAKLDKDKGGKPYWNTPWEKFARAFDAYVSDKLEAKAAKNTYLSHAGRAGETVPKGDERKAINAAFDKLIGELKTKETDQGTALFSRYRHRREEGSLPLAHDFITPETPEYADNTTGDLAYTPRSAIGKGIEQLPIRLTFGDVYGPHRGYGLRHVVHEGEMDISRRVPAYTADDAENSAREAAMLARTFDEIYTEDDKVILRNSRANEAIVAARITDKESGGDFYSIVSVVPSTQPKWGNPVWKAGRAQLPDDRLLKPGAPELSSGRESQQPDRQPLGVFQTEHLDLREAIARKQVQKSAQQPIEKKAVPVTYKRKRSYKTKDEPQFSRAKVASSGGPTGTTTADARKLLVSTFGEPAIRNLEKNGILKIVQNKYGIPDEARGDLRGDEEGVYYNGTGYLIADNLAEGRVVPALLHEVGEHYGLEKMLGENAYKSLMVRVRMMKGTPRVKEAWAAVIKEYPHLEEGKNDFMHDVMARLGEHADVRAKPWYKQVIQAIRLFLLKIGFTRHLSDKHIGELLLASLRKSAEGGPVVLGRESVMQGQPLFSRPSIGNTAQDVRQTVHNWMTDITKTSKTVGPWSKTVGTMYHLASKVPVFKPVFDASQKFISDVSSIAIEAENVAPALFRKMGTIKEALTTGKASDANIAKAEEAIYRGTTEDERIYTPAELKSKYGLSPEQIKIYSQAMNAAHKSLDDLAKSTLYRLARTVEHGLTEAEKAGYRDSLESIKLDTKSTTEFLDNVADRVLTPMREILAEKADAIRSLMDDLTGEERENLKRTLEPIQDRLEVLSATIKDMESVAEKTQSLKDKGYFPLMRFGKYRVDVTDTADGKSERLAFMMFESETEANQAARDLRAAYPEPTVKIEPGIMSQDEWRMFPGLTPDSIESFARQTGTDAKALFQDYLRLAVNNRSAMKRMIHRKKIPGWAKDARRTLATFIVSNARFSSANYHMPDLTQAVENIPKAMGDVKDQAIKLTKYITEPTEELPGLRNFLFFNFIGGSIASSVVNLSQVPMVAYPYLSQFGAGKAAKAITRWMRPGAKPMDTGHEAAIKRAEEEGYISPQEIHNLMATARDLMATARGGALGGGKVLSNRHVQTALYIWGSLFSVAEQYNRRVTFNSAYQIARENGEKNPYDFAVKAVEETQFVYNRGNRPNWARGIAAPLFTFKQFSISYLEMLNRLPTRQKAIAISLLILAAGIQGLPFEDDLEDLIDTLAQWGGYNWSTRKEMEEFARKTIGKEMTLLLMRGAPSAFGVPLDIQSRLGFGNLIPGTAILKPSETNKGRDVAELFGPMADVVQGVGRALEATAKGEPGRAAFSVAPKAVRDLWKGVESSFTGEYRDASGKLIAKIKPSDAAIKALGFNPTAVSDVQRKQRMVDDLITLHKATESGIADKLARGLVFRDTGLAAEARRELADWNRRNPEYPIRITPAQIQQRARQLTRDSSERLIKQAPKEIRGGIRNALS